MRSAKLLKNGTGTARCALPVPVFKPIAKLVFREGADEGPEVVHVDVDVAGEGVNGGDILVGGEDESAPLHSAEDEADLRRREQIVQSGAGRAVGGNELAGLQFARQIEFNEVLALVCVAQADHGADHALEDALRDRDRRHVKDHRQVRLAVEFEKELLKLSGRGIGREMARFGIEIDRPAVEVCTCGPDDAERVAVGAILHVTDEDFDVVPVFGAESESGVFEECILLVPLPESANGCKGGQRQYKRA